MVEGRREGESGGDKDEGKRGREKGWGGGRGAVGKGQMLKGE